MTGKGGRTYDSDCQCSVGHGDSDWGTLGAARGDRDIRSNAQSSSTGGDGLDGDIAGGSRGASVGRSWSTVSPGYNIALLSAGLWQASLRDWRNSGIDGRGLVMLDSGSNNCGRDS